MILEKVVVLPIYSRRQEVQEVQETGSAFYSGITYHISLFWEHLVQEQHSCERVKSKPAINHAIQPQSQHHSGVVFTEFTFKISILGLDRVERIDENTMIRLLCDVCVWIGLCVIWCCGDP